MKKPIIYLAGFISTEYTESLQWRLRVAPHLEKMGFEVRTPLKGKKDLGTKTLDGGMTATSATNKSIVLRDRKDVRESDVILAHMEVWGSPRPLIGTIVELGWAYDQQTPIVAIARADNYLARQHPFLSEFISHYEETEEAALKFLERYYGPYSV